MTADDDPATAEPTNAAADRTARSARRANEREPVLPVISRDEQDVGWGDEPGERDDDWYRRERPPHHGG